MKSSPSNGGWWDRFKEAVLSLPETPQIQSQVTFYLPDGARLDIDKMLEENTRLLEDNQRLRQTLTDTRELRKQLKDAKHNESLMTRRVEAFRKRWPAIHKQFFTAEGTDV